MCASKEGLYSLSDCVLSYYPQSFGVMEGANYSDLIDKAKKAGVKSIMAYNPTGAETIQDLSSRAKAFFCEICK